MFYNRNAFSIVEDSDDVFFPVRRKNYVDKLLKLINKTIITAFTEA